MIASRFFKIRQGLVAESGIKIAFKRWLELSLQLRTRVGHLRPLSAIVVTISCRALVVRFRDKY